MAPGPSTGLVLSLAVCSTWFGARSPGDIAPTTFADGELPRPPGLQVSGSRIEGSGVKLAAATVTARGRDILLATLTASTTPAPKSEDATSTASTVASSLETLPQTALELFCATAAALLSVVVVVLLFAKRRYIIGCREISVIVVASVLPPVVLATVAFQGGSVSRFLAFGALGTFLIAVVLVSVVRRKSATSIVVVSVPAEEARLCAQGLPAGAKADVQPPGSSRSGTVAQSKVFPAHRSTLRRSCSPIPVLPRITKSMALTAQHQRVHAPKPEAVRAGTGGCAILPKNGKTKEEPPVAIARGITRAPLRLTQPTAAVPGTGMCAGATVATTIPTVNGRVQIFVDAEFAAEDSAAELSAVVAQMTEGHASTKAALEVRLAQLKRQRQALKRRRRASIG